MIVKRSWRTVQHIKPTEYESKFGKWRVRNWRGWFLFGIIPIYIEQTSHSYEKSIP